MRKSLLVAAALLGLVLTPATTEAQRRGGWGKSNPWSFAPYGGLFRDAYDASADGKDTGWMVGFRVGYDLGSRSRLVGNIGYAESDDVALDPLDAPRVIYDNQYIITTGGLEYDIIPGNTSVSLGVELGGLWREVAQDDQVGQPLPGQSLESGFSFNFAVVPALTVRHGFTPRTALEIGVRDFILPEEQVEHMPAITLGFRFR